MLVKSSIRPLARCITASNSQTRAPISNTAKKAGLKDLGAGGAASSLIQFDDDSNKSTSNPSSTWSSTDYSRPATRGPRPAGSFDNGAAHLSEALHRGGGYNRVDRNRLEIEKTIALNSEREDLARRAPRSWRDGDVYSPHDLSIPEMKKWGRAKQPTRDVFDMLGMNPLDHYKNFSIISEYVTEQGRIKPNKMTGLRLVNQRKIAKAIRRAIGMGIHPSTHRHPEILFSDPFSGPRYTNMEVKQEDSKDQPVKPV